MTRKDLLEQVKLYYAKPVIDIETGIKIFLDKL